MGRISGLGLLWLPLILVTFLTVITVSCDEENSSDSNESGGSTRPAAESAHFADHWSGLEPADGETWVYHPYNSDGTPAAEEYSVAISYGYHAEAAAGGNELLFHHYWTVSTSIYNPPVWNPDSNLYGWMRGSQGEIWFMGFSAGDGVFRAWEEPELIMPGGELPDAGTRWGEWEHVTGWPDPVEEITWSHRVEALNVTLETDYDTFTDCIKIYNKRESKMEYWSPSGGGLVAWQQVEDLEAELMGRWNRLAERTTDPNWNWQYFE